MQIKLDVKLEEARMSGNVEYVTASGFEDSPTPILQGLDYSLAPDERHMKGKLIGKKLTIQVHSIGDLFAGRPRLSGKILKAEDK